MLKVFKRAVFFVSTVSVMVVTVTAPDWMVAAAIGVWFFVMIMNTADDHY